MMVYCGVLLKCDDGVRVFLLKPDSSSSNNNNNNNNNRLHEHLHTFQLASGFQLPVYLLSRRTFEAEVVDETHPVSRIFFPQVLKLFMVASIASRNWRSVPQSTVQFAAHLPVLKTPQLLDCAGLRYDNQLDS